MRFEWLNGLFDFSRKERNGILILLSIIFLLLILRIVLPIFMPVQKVDVTKWNAEVNQFLLAQEVKIPDSIRVVPFDPNKVDSLTLVYLGVPARVVGYWLNYRRKGGVIRDMAGVARIYGMTPGVIEKLKGYLIFDKPDRHSVAFIKVNVVDNNLDVVKDKVVVERYVAKIKPNLSSIELNGADSLSLIRIPGIGPVLASRIIRYRKLLGGFYTIDQLREVYGLRSANFETLAPYMTIDPSAFANFNLNFSTFQELCRHPYVGYKLAKKIMRLRDQKGKFSYVADLSLLVGVDSLNRLKPYLRFSD